MSDSKKNCIFCDRDSHQAPLIKFRFQDKKYSICPQHFPYLIHEPAKLVGKLPGAENLIPTDFEH